MTTRTQEYTSAGSYSFSVPAGVSCVLVTAIAGGGAGGKGDTGFPVGGGAGGAGECCSRRPQPVTPGGTLSVVIGAGGISLTTNGPNATNVHVGPEGAVAPGAGFGGDDTVVGEIRLKGGYGGLRNPSQPHGGKGGGFANLTGTFSNDGGAIVATWDQGDITGNVNAQQPYRKGNIPHYGGTGGGAGGTKPTAPLNGGNGGPCGPYLGGAGGTADATNAGGGGGGASRYGPGAAGGQPCANASSVPAGSYGAGGAGAGGCIALFKLGSAGADGYAQIMWVEP